MSGFRYGLIIDFQPVKKHVPACALRKYLERLRRPGLRFALTTDKIRPQACNCKGGAK